MASRNTKQKELLEKEIKKIKTFFSAEQLHKKVQEKGIGIATIYRFLSDQQKKGNIYGYECDRRMVYSTSNKSHCHFICEQSGKVIHIDIDSIDFLKNKLPGDITSFQLEIRGICKDCK